MNSYQNTDIIQFITTFKQASLHNDLKPLVKQLILDELFYKELLNNINLSYLKNDIKYQNQLDVPIIVKNQLSLLLSGEVSKEINNQMPNYLNNNFQMNNLLLQHKNYLENQLEIKANTIIQNIVDNDNYHVINKCYFDEFENRSNKKIYEFETKSNNKIVELNTKYNNDFKTIKDIIDTNKELNNKIKNIEYNFNILTTVGITCLSIGIITFLIKNN